MRQKGAISEPLLTLQHGRRPLGHCATRKGSSYTKNECSLFYQKLDAEYFFLEQFFRKKKTVFPEKIKELFWGHI